MIKKYSLLFLLCLTFLTLHAQKQSSTGRSSFYVGIQAGAPLFWGDLSSVGEKFRPGFGGGIFFGYRATSWLAIEFDSGFMTAKLRPTESQVNDFIDHQGFIRYTQGSYKLDNIYSKVRLSRYGLRLPVQVLNIFKEEGKFNVELAPHIYLNQFNSAIYNTTNDQKLMNGAPPKPTSYAIGGDLGFSYKINRQTRLFLRSSFSWLSDDQYEAVTTHPAWKENVMLYTTVGVSFDIDFNRHKNNF